MPIDPYLNTYAREIKAQLVRINKLEDREKRLREALARLYSANRGASSVETLITALEHAKTILDEGDS